MKQAIAITIFILSVTFASGQAIKPDMTAEQVKTAQASISKKLGQYPSIFEPWKGESERKIKLEKVVVTPAQNRIHLYLNEPFGQISIREDIISNWEQIVRDTLGSDYESCRVQLYCRGVEIERYVPNVYRSRLAKDRSRKGTPSKKTPLTQNLDRPRFSKGLSNRHIALWASHGKYYDADKEAWIFQRPPLFGSIEDLNSFEYTYRYLIPMLENAGAVVISPRERDPNPTEIIVDETKAKILKGKWDSFQGGFKEMAILRDENPFEMGSYLVSANGGWIEYPIKAERGEYALYVSYKTLPLCANVEYIVEHAGGKTRYKVNQQMGAGWIYLGTHVFDNSSKVMLYSDGYATADAIRLGGGMGTVERNGKTSGAPRWAEGARYYLQYSGVPSYIYAQDTEKAKDPKNKNTNKSKKGKEEKLDKDYSDDYKSRGDWADWLKNERGVPIDASVALHTNAGFNDSIFGTLMICYTGKGKGKYDNGSSKFAGRDMAEIIMEQLVSDLRANHSEQWTRRSIYDKGYREVMGSTAPSVIVELLSHQNMNDMIYALDPKFRFDASRAIYKGILKFLAEQYSVPYIVQPLPPTDFTMSAEGDNLRMSWKEQEDDLEPTAKPVSYKLYTRMGEGGFDNGVTVKGCEFSMPIQRDGKVRSYRITAINDGGESFSTEILSACFLQKSAKLAMVVNEYTLLCAPDTMKGGLDFANFTPFQHDYGIVGMQKNFDRKSEFIDNENPGWGASEMNLATKGLPGNTFDYTVQKGAALIKEGFSYISSSSSGYDPKKRYDKVVKISEPAR